MDKVKDNVGNMSAIEHADQAIANVKANASSKGLSPQQERAIAKFQAGQRLLKGTQTTPIDRG